MTISLVGENSQTIAAIEDLAARMLDQGSIRAERLDRGANSRVYLLTDETGRRYVAKFYFRNPNDKRERLEVEFSSLSFLWDQGLTNVQHPIAIDREESCAIYEYVEGRKIPAEDIAVEDIDYAVDFLVQLKGLREKPLAQKMPAASDACFSIEAIILNIQNRLNRLAILKETGEEYGSLRTFLDSDLRPLFETLTGWAQSQCKNEGITFENDIASGQRILSPSDFGFHNALRAQDGRIIFLDFEYFGWDDPAKTISDFLLHPAMGLKDPLKEMFVQKMLAAFKENGSLAQRLEIVYPLYGLKWCTIFLNEFVPDDFSRRVYAAGNPLNKAQVRQGQLLKAANLLQKIKDTYKEFPYAS